jgi:carboxymethylenebutenolidase
MNVTLDVNGKDVNCYLAIPASGKGPGVIVLHAWWGLTQVFRELCDRLAAEGYVAFAPDLHDGRTANTIDEAKAIMEHEDYQRKSEVANAAVAYLAGHPAVIRKDLGVIGFSMGAAYALVLSAIAAQNTCAVVLFYGSYVVEFKRARAAYLGHFAEHDEWESNEDALKMETAMREAGREVTLHTYPGTDHWFFEQNRPEYKAPAAALAWHRTLEFLRDKLS